MRLVLQRVARARVEVGGERVAAIGAGLLVLVAIEPGDGDRELSVAAEKLVRLRIFEDERGRFDRDLLQAGGAILLVSQFTLVASTDRGRRPSFERAAPPDQAEPMIARLAARLEALGARVETGRFGARMQVALVNDGPVTLVLDIGAGETGRSS